MDLGSFKSAVADGVGGGNKTRSTYSFLVHSQASVIHNTLPRVDSIMMGRQKRRRTSPEDRAVLEAAYLRNSNLEKAERLEIVNRVSLGEKEVQVWFQNRRQNVRRKTKPLLPHEMVPLFRNSIPNELLHDPKNAPFAGCMSNSQSPLSSFDGSEADHSRSRDVDGPRGQVASRSSSIHDLLNPVTTPTSSASSFSELQTSQCPVKDGPEQAAGSSSAQNLHVGIFDNCKNHKLPTRPVSESISRHDLDQKAAAVSILQHRSDSSQPAFGGQATGSVPPPITKKRRLEQIEDLRLHPRQSSGVRLSMTVDGAVKIKTTDEETPSPPKQRQGSSLQPRGLKRSQSAVGVFGRSRDARTWEFYCDADARSALSTQAENENSGSAVGVINLIRAQNQTAKGKAQPKGSAIALKPKNGAMNGRRSVNVSDHKPKLARSMSSMARFSGRSSVDSVQKQPKVNTIPAAGPPSSDSDKENWAPGTRSANHPLRRTQPSATTSPDVLKYDAAAGSSTSASSKRWQADQELGQFGLANALGPKDGAAFDSFVSGEGEGEDLDCVQGLLSLSQGAWK